MGGLFNIPDPVSIFESAKGAQLEREEIGALTSASYSALISFLWRSGSSKPAVWLGFGQALKDAAASMYLTLRLQMKPGFLTLTVPQDLLDPNVLNKFQSEQKAK